MDTAQPAMTLPEPNGDFYHVIDTLNDAERQKLKQVRAFIETKVVPIINKYWAEDSFPFETVPSMDTDLESLRLKPWE